MSRSQSICTFPFNHIAIDATGHYRLCCEAKSTQYTIQDYSLKNWFQSDYIKQVRESMLSGEKIKDCENCYYAEKRNLTSKRLKDRKDLNISDYALPAEVRSLDLRISNQCNAKCPTCGPQDSSLWRKDYKKLIAEKVFNQEDLPDKPKTDQSRYSVLFNDLMEMDIVEAYLAGGEPFIMPELLTFLDRLNDQCNIQINTNLSILNDKLMEKIKLFDNVDLIISCDGTDQGFDFMRYPVKFNHFIDNLTYIFDKIPKVSIYLNFTLSVFNLSELMNVVDLFIDYSNKYSTTKKVEINFVSQPSYLSVHALSLDYRNNLAEKLRDYIQKKENQLKEIDVFDRLIEVVQDIESRERISNNLLIKTRQYTKWLHTNRKPSSTFLEHNGVLSDLTLS